MSTDWEVKRKLYLWIKIRFYRSGGEIYRIWLRPLIIDVSIETTSFSIEIISWPVRRAHSWAQWPSNVRDSNARDFISQLSIQVQDFWKIDPCGYPLSSTQIRQINTIPSVPHASSTKIRQFQINLTGNCVELTILTDLRLTNVLNWKNVLNWRMKWRISGAEKHWPW